MKPANRALINEWLNKAEGDYEAAIYLNKSKSKKRTLSIIAFHCQQAVEKLLKSLLIAYGIDFPKIHDLVQLLKILERKDPLFKAMEKEANRLNPFAVGYRYPGEDIEPSELKDAIKTTKILRSLLLKRIKEFLP